VEDQALGRRRISLPQIWSQPVTAVYWPIHPGRYNPAHDRFCSGTPDCSADKALRRFFLRLCAYCRLPCRPTGRRLWSDCSHRPIAHPLVLGNGADLLSTTVLPVILYFALQEGGATQATWGKRRAGIRVTVVTNQLITYRQAFVRAIIKFAPWQLAHTSLIHMPGWPLAVETVGTVSMVGLVVAQGLVLLYILGLLLSPTRRTPYDWGARTVVVAEN
jgi:uncharacterized RDD family membrane protein YckC